MHYSDGTEAKVGDVVHVPVKEGTSGTELIGVLVSGSTSSPTCNGSLSVGLQREVSLAGISQWRKYEGVFAQCFTISDGKKLL